MTLEDFKEIHAGKTAEEKLDLLIENEGYRRNNAVSAERDRMNHNTKGEEYCRSEEQHMLQRIVWLYGEIKKALKEKDRDTIRVVRCADCKYCFDWGGDPMEPYDGESEWYCERWDKETSAYGTDPYRFYCADGERRDDDGNR